jgi:hypothetical protein
MVGWGVTGNVCRIDGETCGIHPFGRLKRKWDDNIKMDLKKIYCENGRLLELAQNCV